jgi:hypothetical protein
VVLRIDTPEERDTAISVLHLNIGIATRLNPQSTKVRLRKELYITIGELTAATKVDFDRVSYRMNANFPLRSLTTWLAGTGPLSLRVL